MFSHKLAIAGLSLVAFGAMAAGPVLAPGIEDSSHRPEPGPQ